MTVLTDVLPLHSFFAFGSNGWFMFWETDTFYPQSIEKCPEYCGRREAERKGKMWVEKRINGQPTAKIKIKSPKWGKDPGFFMHREFKKELPCANPLTCTKIWPCADKTQAHISISLPTKKHESGFRRSRLACHLCHIWASKMLGITQNHMFKCVESGMKWKPVTSGKEGELQQACHVHKSVKRTWSTDAMMHEIRSIRQGWLSAPLKKRKRKKNTLRLFLFASQHCQI